MRTALRWAPVVLGLLAAGCNAGEPYVACGPGVSCSGDTRLCLSSSAPAPSTNAVRFCTKRCATPSLTPSDCPGNGVCIRLNGADPVCVPRCTAATGCGFPGASCRALPESLGATVCAVAP